MAYHEFQRDITREVTNLYDCGSQSPRIMSPHRKAKRPIPDSDKDDKYWEKRKRNNIAAKKSRENKRMADYEVRNELKILQQENNLLKKEIAVLKAEFGIPQGQSVLTTEQRNDCISETSSHESRDYTDERPLTPDLRSKTDDGAFLRVKVKSENEIGHKQEYEDKCCRMNDYNSPVDMMNHTMALYAPVNAMLWAATPAVPVNMQQAHEQSQHSLVKNRDVFSSSPFQYYFTGAAKHRSFYEKTDNVPDDLSIMKEDVYGADFGKKDEIRNGENRKSINGFYNYVSDSSLKPETPPYSDFNGANNGHLAKENRDLKRKLMQLSTRVQEMKNVVMVD